MDESESGERPRLQRIWIDDGHLQFVDAANKTDIEVDVASHEPDKPGGGPPVALEGGGKWAGNRFTLEGTAESPLELQQTDKPYRIDLRAAAGATRAHARGTLVNPFQFRSFDLRMALSGQNLEDLSLGRAHVCTPVTNAHLVCRLLLDKTK